MELGGVSDGREYHQAQPWNGKSRDDAASVPVRCPDAENFDQRQVRGFASELFLYEILPNSIAKPSPTAEVMSPLTYLAVVS